MKYTNKRAVKIAKEYGVSPVTLRVWKSRGAIPDKYFEKEDRISLREVLTAEVIQGREEKHGIELTRLIDAREFRPGQNDSYYMTCLLSLCKECNLLR